MNRHNKFSLEVFSEVNRIKIMMSGCSSFALLIAGAGLFLSFSTQSLCANPLNIGAGKTYDNNGDPFTAYVENGGTAINNNGGTLNLEGASINITADGGGSRGLMVSGTGKNNANVTIKGTEANHANINLNGNGAVGITGYGYNNGPKSNFYLENVDIDILSGTNTKGININAPGTVEIIGGRIRAASGISLMGMEHALIDGTKIITSGGPGMVLAGGGVIMDGPSIIEVRHFDITTGVDLITGIENGSSYAYGMNIGKYGTTYLSNGRIETWGTGSNAIWASGDYNDSSKNTFYAKNLDIITHGSNASGYDFAFATAEIDGGNITTYGLGGHAIGAGNGGFGAGSNVTITGTNITTHGQSGYGLVAVTSSTINGIGLNIKTTGQGAIGARSNGSGRVNLSHGTKIETSGTSAYGAAATFGSEISLTDSSVLTKGDNAAALYLVGYNTPVNVTPTTKHVNVANAKNSRIEAQNAAALGVRGGGENTFNLEDSHIVGNGDNAMLFFSDEYIYDDGKGTVIPMAVGTVDVNANASLLQGDILVNSGVIRFDLKEGSLLEGAALLSAQDLTVDHIGIDAASAWKITGNSVVNNLHNAGTISFGAPDEEAFKSLIVRGDYDSEDGSLILNSRLGNESSLTDKVIFEGAVTGTTHVSVQNSKGLGALTTGSGINIIDAQNAQSNAFVQKGRIAAGAYEYTLYAGYDDVYDGNWYLRSIYKPVDPIDPVDPKQPDYRAEVATNMVTSVLASKLGLAMLGTRDDRALRQINEFFWIHTFGETGKVGKNKGNTLSRHDDFLKYGPGYDYNLGGVRLGADIYELEKDNTSSTLGVYAGIGYLDSDIRGVYEGKAGKTAMTGYTLGAYWNLTGEQGWYVDTVLQATRYSNIRAVSARDEMLKSGGWGLAASVEGGYPIALGDDWSLEPQAQLIYQYTSLDDGSDNFGKTYFDDTNTVYGRLGARLNKNWKTSSGSRLTSWIRANVWSSFNVDAKTTFTTLTGTDALTLKTDMGGTWGQIGFGVSGNVSEKTKLFGSLDYNHSLGGNRSQNLAGRIGLSVTW